VTQAPASSPVVFSTSEAIRQALFDPNLSRSFDKRRYHEGNIRDGIVSISHGPMQRARRRLENSQFRPDRLRLYERELFPRILDDLLDLLIDGEHADIFSTGEMLSVVLAARRAGLDIDDRSLDQLRDLVQIVDVFSQGSAILDARDPAAVRALVYQTHERFEREYVRPSWERRAAAIETARSTDGSAPISPSDILSALLLHRGDPALELKDDGRIVREVATYLQGGTHTSAQTLTNALDLMFAERPRQPGILTRAAEDRAFAQRVVHETLRLRPTTPRIKRLAEEDTRVAGVAIERGTVVVLDVATANRDPVLYGPDADDFRPDRELDPEVARWGMSFGAGAHQCPGRTVAAGFPVEAGSADDPEHLFGLIALMIGAVARRGVEPDPERAPERDTRTERETRWRCYPVRFTRQVAAGGPESPAG
jgi:cytochrome P450